MDAGGVKKKYNTFEKSEFFSVFPFPFLGNTNVTTIFARACWLLYWIVWAGVAKDQSRRQQRKRFCTSVAPAALLFMLTDFKEATLSPSCSLLEMQSPLGSGGRFEEEGVKRGMWGVSRRKDFSTRDMLGEVELSETSLYFGGR